MIDPLGNAACRIIARGRITRRWTEGHRNDRTFVVLVEGPGDDLHAVVDSGCWWSAHPVTSEDVDYLELLAKRQQLYNASAALGRPLRSPPCRS